MDPSEQSRLAYRCQQYSLIEDTLYRKGVVQPLLKCITRHEGKELIVEAHQGFSGCHVDPRTLTSKICALASSSLASLGTHKMLPKVVRHAKSSPQARGPSQKSKLIAPTWLLHRWGIDIVTPPYCSREPKIHLRRC